MKLTVCSSASGSGQPALEVCARGGDHGIDHEREQDQETRADHEHERIEPGAQHSTEGREHTHVLGRSAFHAPDEVERFPQFVDEGRRAEEQRHQATEGRDDAAGKAGALCQHQLGGLCALGAEQSFQPRCHFASRRGLTNEEARNACDDDEDGCNGEERVVCERGPETRSVICGPVVVSSHQE